MPSIRRKPSSRKVRKGKGKTMKSCWGGKKGRRTRSKGRKMRGGCNPDNTNECPSGQYCKDLSNPEDSVAFGKCVSNVPSFSKQYDNAFRKQ